MRIILIFIIFFIAIIGIVQLRMGLHGPDVENYYAIAKSLSFDRDLMFNNEFEAIGYPLVISPTYHIIEYHQIGVPLMWMFIFDFLKSIRLTNEGILRISINLFEYFLSLLALIFMFKILIKFFDPKTAFLSLIAVLFGTNLFAYTSLLAGASHISSIFFVSAVLFFYFNTRSERSKIDWLILGGLSGLMLMARGETALYLVFPIFDLIVYLKNRRLKSTLYCGFIFILGLLFTFYPQIVFWKIIFGKIFWSYDGSYGASDLFAGNKFLEVLFSYSRGFFFFSPLLAVCFLIGIFYLYKKDKPLAIFTVLIFLALDYGVGRAKYGWWQGCSFGGRYFLIFMPLFILSVAACFKRISFKSQIAIAVISAIWSFLLFFLFIFNKELESYKGVASIFDLGFFNEILQYVYQYIKDVISKRIFLKLILLGIVSLLILLFWNKLKKIKINKILLKKLAVCLVGGMMIYIYLIFIQCYFNDKKVILTLKEKGFYENAVFGDFGRSDIADAYLEFTVGALGDGDISSAIDVMRRAVRLYPPNQEVCFERLYEIYAISPEKFKVEFLINPDPYDYLGLSFMFFEKREFKNARYYFKKAMKLKPDIIQIIKEKKDPYLRYRLDKVLEFVDKIKKEKYDEKDIDN